MFKQWTGMNVASIQRVIISPQPSTGVWRIAQDLAGIRTYIRVDTMSDTGARGRRGEYRCIRSVQPTGHFFSSVQLDVISPLHIQFVLEHHYKRLTLTLREHFSLRRHVLPVMRMTRLCPDLGITVSPDV